jgi:hypothetical protein
MLIYIISLTPQSTIDMTINNQCSSIELASPVYFVEDETYHISFPQQVSFKSIMKASFGTSMNGGTFGGVLLYRLQRKEDTSTSIQLLVIWRYKSDGLYSHTLLIEHESTLVWDKDKLKMLYDGYYSQHEAYYNINTRECLLDNNTKLKLDLEPSSENFKIGVIISEDGPDLAPPKKPLWIDSNR